MTLHLQPSLNHSNNEFSRQLLAWSVQHGRFNLPWQKPNPYIVWLSEIMLQQTQVKTVIPYFKKFIDAYPTVHDLADAPWESIATLWAGLGYYARARNLHKSAKLISDYVNQHGAFPNTLEQWVSFPGIGPSTAGAIMAMGCLKYGVILDGNVKRVLTRYLGIADDITKSATIKQLWHIADVFTPNKEAGKYAQAIMDLGATICTRKNTQCTACPFSASCASYLNETVDTIPYKPKKKPKPNKYSDVILIKHQNTILWLTRPEKGIWGGLICLPLHNFEEKPLSYDEISKIIHQESVMNHSVEQKNPIYDNAYVALHNNLYHPISTAKPIKHTLTHFHWHLTTKCFEINQQQYENINKLLVQSKITHQWLSLKQAPNLALPKAMLKILKILETV